MALATAASIALGIAGGLAGGAAFSKALSKPAGIASSPMPLPKPPAASDVSAKTDEIIRKKRASATQSIYTSPLGIAGEAQVARKTLLGQ